MTKTLDILLLPPPAAPVAKAAKADRAAALAPIAPAQPPRADKDRDVASDQLGFRRSGSSARDATATARQAGRGERWLASDLVDAESLAAGLRLTGLPFLAQQIAQEALSSGLHREPWDAGLTAYRRAGGEPPLPTSGAPLVQLSA